MIRTAHRFAVVAVCAHQLDIALGVAYASVQGVQNKTLRERNNRGVLAISSCKAVVVIAHIGARRIDINVDFVQKTN